MFKWLSARRWEAGRPSARGRVALSHEPLAREPQTRGRGRRLRLTCKRNAGASAGTRARRLFSATSISVRDSRTDPRAPGEAPGALALEGRGCANLARGRPPEPLCKLCCRGASRQTFEYLVPNVTARPMSLNHDGRQVCPLQMGKAIMACEGDSRCAVISGIRSDFWVTSKIFIKR